MYHFGMFRKKKGVFMEKDMTKGRPLPVILKFILPLIIGNIFQQLYNMADTIIVGRYVGSDALAAVGSTGTIMFLIVGFAQGITAGFSVLTAQRFGAKDNEGVKSSVANGILLSLIFTVVLSALSMLSMHTLLKLMNTPDNIFQDAYTYIMIISAGLGATIFYNLFSSYLRAVGNSKIPLVFLVFSAALNVILDLVLIINVKMGVAGAAYATVISQGVSAILCLIYIYIRIPSLAPNRRHWKLHGQESRNQLAKALENTDMVFVTAGMGGGTGTGAAPVVAEAAKEQGVLTVGVVTKPFAFEGRKRMTQAEQGIEELRGKVDSLVIIPNERLKYATDQKITFANAFEIADDVLRQAVVSISDLIRDTGFINLDFADVTAVMKDAGLAHMGVGRAAGKGKAEEAARMAISSPLLETSIQGAKGVLINVTGSMDIGLEEVEQAATLVQEAVHPDALTIFGATFDENLDDEIRVTVIATGFAEPDGAAKPAASAAAKATEEKPAAELEAESEEEARQLREEQTHFDDILKIFERS